MTDDTLLAQARDLRVRGYTLLASNRVSNHLEGMDLLEEAKRLDPDNKAGPSEEELKTMVVTVDDEPFDEPESPRPAPKSLMDRLPLTKVRRLR